jgi:chromosome segregation ATPase
MKELLADKCGDAVVKTMVRFVSEASRSAGANDAGGENDAEEEEHDGEDSGAGARGRKRKRNEKGKGKKRARVTHGQLDPSAVRKVVEAVEWLGKPEQWKDDDDEGPRQKEMFERCKEATITEERVLADRTPEETNSKLVKKKALFKKESEKHGAEDPDSLRRQFKFFKNEYEKQLRKKQTSARSYTALSDSWKAHREKFKTMKKFIKNQLRFLFNEELSKRGSEGKLHIDFKNQEMGIEVNTKADDETQDTQVTDMKALSGGERSFTTLSLMVAMWAASEGPFRLLDEFDVFMDAINRGMALGTLTKAAIESYPDNQFIFITPTAVGDLEKKHPSKVKVYRMKEPVRASASNPMQQSTLD